MLFLIGCIVGLYLSFLYLQKKQDKNKVIVYVIGGLVGGLVVKFLSSIISTILFIIIVLGLGLVGFIIIKRITKE